MLISKKMLDSIKKQSYEIGLQKGYTLGYMMGKIEQSNTLNKGYGRTPIPQYLLRDFGEIDKKS